MPGPSCPNATRACPFCPGNEDQTPPEILRDPPGPDWRARVVPNMYAALSGDGSAGPIGRADVPRDARHREPRGDDRDPPARWPDGRDVPGRGSGGGPGVATAIPRADRETRRPRRGRVQELRNPGGISLALRTHRWWRRRCSSPGCSAGSMWRRGTSTSTGPVVRRADRCRAPSERAHGRRGRRVRRVRAVGGQTPFKTWIAPAFHQGSFGDLADEAIEDLAGILIRTLTAVRRTCGDPDYNLVMYSAPPTEGTPSRSSTGT